MENKRKLKQLGDVEIKLSEQELQTVQPQLEEEGRLSRVDAPHIQTSAGAKNCQPWKLTWEDCSTLKVKQVLDQGKL